MTAKLFVSAVICATPFFAGGEQLDPQDSKTILQEFLDIDEPGLNDLDLMQKRGEVYAKYSKASKAGDALAAKVMLFYAYLTPRHSGATSEALLSDLVPIFNKQPDVILKTLQRNHLLIAPVCDYLSGHFGFEDVPEGGRKVFLKRHAAAINKTLGINAKKCTDEFAGR